MSDDYIECDGARYPCQVDDRGRVMMEVRHAHALHEAVKPTRPYGKPQMVLAHRAPAYVERIGDSIDGEPVEVSLVLLPAPPRCNAVADCQLLGGHPGPLESSVQPAEVAT